MEELREAGFEVSKPIRSIERTHKQVGYRVLTWSIKDTSSGSELIVELVRNTNMGALSFIRGYHFYMHLLTIFDANDNMYSQRATSIDEIGNSEFTKYSREREVRALRFFNNEFMFRQIISKWFREISSN